MKFKYRDHLYGPIEKHFITIIPYNEFIAFVPGPLTYKNDDSNTEKLLKFAAGVIDDIMSGKIAIPKHILSNLVMPYKVSTLYNPSLYGDIVDSTGNLIGYIRNYTVSIDPETNIIRFGGYDIIFNDSNDRWDVFNSGTFICSVDDSEDINDILNAVLKEM